MLCTFQSTYHRVVQDFRLGRHSFSSATLQSVVEQYMAYNKDPWKGRIGKDGKPVRSPSANAAGAGAPGIKSNPYDAMEACSFGTDILHWHIGCKDSYEKCLVCHNMLNKPAHHTKDCPILKQIGLKLVKRTPADGSDAASRVGESLAPAPAPAPPAPAPSADGGPAATPGAFTAATEAASYDSGEEFDYEGKYEGSVYSGKSRSSVSDYPHASHATAEPLATTSGSPPSCRRTTWSTDPKGFRTVYLPKLVLALLHGPAAHSTAFISTKDHPGHNSLLVADTGATDHMLPDKSAFISYRPVTGCRVRMGNNSFAPILGSGLAVISVNGRQILIWNCLHIPALRNPHQKPSFGHS